MSSVWFITGSSSGFGRSLVTQALAAGERVIATARRPETLHDLAAQHPDTLHAFTLDVTEAAQVQEVVGQAAQAFGRLDVVVNNAGYGLLGGLEEYSEAQIRHNIGTNLLGPLHVMRAALPILRAQGSGHIVNVSAIAAFNNHPGFSVYGGAKAGLEAASDALRQEVAPLGITVTVVSPGPYRTDFIGRSLERAAGHIADYDRTSGKFAAYLEKINGRQPGDPDRAAAAIVQMVRDGGPPRGCSSASMPWARPGRGSPNWDATWRTGKPSHSPRIFEGRSHMRAIEVATFGGPEQLKLVDRPRPEPGPGQVLIEVQAAGINFADLLAREGKYPPGPKPPFVPGMEAAGTVAAVGAGVTAPAVGTRVMAFVSGGYAEYALADAAQTVPLPDALDFAPATALLVQGLTAYFLLKRAAELKPGQSVLVSAAAGGVGSLAVQIAKRLGGGTVLGTASTPEKRELVTSLGADAAIDYTQPGWAEAVKADTGGKGVDIFLDATGDTAGGGLKPLGPGGIWVIYGSQQGAHGGLTGDELVGTLFTGQTIRGFSLYQVFSDPPALAAALHEMMGWAASGALKVDTDDRFPLAEAAQAHIAIAARRTTGKVVLEP